MWDKAMRWEHIAGVSVLLRDRDVPRVNENKEENNTL